MSGGRLDPRLTAALDEIQASVDEQSALAPLLVLLKGSGVTAAACPDSRATAKCVPRVCDGFVLALARAVPARGDAPQQPDQAEVPERVREFGPVARLEVRQQVELAAIVGAVAHSSERHDAVRLIAAAERQRSP
jgi:hypothetical protein